MRPLRRDILGGNGMVSSLYKRNSVAGSNTVRRGFGKKSFLKESQTTGYVALAAAPWLGYENFEEY